MRLSLTLEYRFDSTPDGQVWTQTAYSYPFWQYYLEVFDTVQVVARVRPVPVVPEGSVQVDGPGVCVAPLAHYVGPVAYVRQHRAIRRQMEQAISAQDAVILRIPSQLATISRAILKQRQQPFGVIVVGDPYDVFAPGTISHPLRPFFRWWFTRQQQRQCAEAVAAAYVTSSMLQRRYPPARNVFSTAYSDVELTDSAFVTQARQVPGSAQRLMTVMSLDQLYKAPDVLLDALAENVRAGLDLHLTIVGDGRYRPMLEQRAADLGIRERVAFAGQLAAGEAVRQQLDRADLFVLPSRTEGLPRALIEAMARGLPAIGSTAGGIPELLPTEALVPPGDVAALAAKIREVVVNPARMALMSAQNLDKARQYHERLLHERRVAFCQYVKEQTEAWQKR